MYTVYIPTNTKLHIQWSTYKTEEFTVYSYSKKTLKNYAPLFCFGLATAPHKQCFAWPSSGGNIA